MALFWGPIDGALAQPLGVIGSIVGLAARIYALALLGPMPASTHAMPLKRTWLALLLVVALGALLATLTFVCAFMLAFVFAGAWISSLLR